MGIPPGCTQLSRRPHNVAFRLHLYSVHLMMGRGGERNVGGAGLVRSKEEGEGGLQTYRRIYLQNWYCIQVKDCLRGRTVLSPCIDELSCPGFRHHFPPDHRYSADISDHLYTTSPHLSVHSTPPPHRLYQALTRRVGRSGSYGQDVLADGW